MAAASSFASGPSPVQIEPAAAKSTRSDARLLSLQLAAGTDGGAFDPRHGSERWALEKMAIVEGKLATEAVGLCYAWFAHGRLKVPACALLLLHHH